MNVAEKVRKLVQSKGDEQDTIIIRDVKYKSVKNGWVPILDTPTVSLIDFSKAKSSDSKV